MNINELISNYLNAKADKRDAEKREKAAAALIMEYAGNTLQFETDVYSVIIKETESVRLDTAALYEDFPDIKETYGKTTISRSITAAERTAHEKRSA